MRFDDQSRHKIISSGDLSPMADNSLAVVQGGQFPEEIKLSDPWETIVMPEVFDAILRGEASIATIVAKPEIHDMITFDALNHGRQLKILQSILPTSAADITGLSYSDLRRIAELQDASEHPRHQAALFDEYLKAGGNEQFTGSLRWGLVDRTYITQQPSETGTNVKFGVRLATMLPHVRYDWVFRGNPQTLRASISQSLVTDQKTAMLPTGFDSWYGSVRSAPALPSNT